MYKYIYIYMNEWINTYICIHVYIYLFIYKNHILKNTHSVYENRLIDTYTYLCELGILAAAKEHGHDACGGNISGMYGFFFTAGPVNCFEDAAKSGSLRT
jgi:glutamate-1-semialdehyde aminotransferase